MGAPFQFEYQAGSPVDADGYRLVPITKTLCLNNSQGNAWLLWSRPSAILVQNPDSSEDIVPIHDLTVRIIASIFGVCIGAVVLTGIISKISHISSRRKK